MYRVRVPCPHRPRSRAGEPTSGRSGRLCCRRRGVAGDRLWRSHGPALSGPAGRRAGQPGRHRHRSRGSTPPPARPAQDRLAVHGGRPGPVSGRHGHRDGVLAARSRSVPGHRRRVLRRLLPGSLRRGLVPDPRQVDAGALAAARPRQHDFCRRIRRVLLVAGHPPGRGGGRDRLPHASAQSGVPCTELRAAARLRGAAAGRCRQPARPDVAAGRIHHDVPRRHPVDAGEGRRGLSTGRPAGRALRQLLPAARRGGS